MNLYLLDANVISETSNPLPDPKVLAWLQDPEITWMVPAPVVAEIQEGITATPSQRRRMELDGWFDAFLNEAIVLDWDAGTARAWGKLKHSGAVRRQPQTLWDSLIDAMAFHHGATLATRNTRDFRHAKTYNPWTGLEHSPAE